MQANYSSPYGPGDRVLRSRRFVLSGCTVGIVILSCRVESVFWFDNPCCEGGLWGYWLSDFGLFSSSLSATDTEAVMAPYRAIAGCKEYATEFELWPIPPACI
ncbi:MAG: hypothetical protein MH825_08330 [Cyanobacteria bacterium]|nr:hypothetical protein [Cyanobacteriota bacterium]